MDVTSFSRPVDCRTPLDTGQAAAPFPPFYEKSAHRRAGVNFAENV